MKFVHTADLHVGANRYLADYLNRQEEMLDSIFDVAYDNDVNVVVIAGDIFDDPETTTQEEREMVERKLLEYDAAGFSILMIPGNHDLIDATGYTAIHYLALLSQYGKFKNSYVTETTMYVTLQDVVFCLLCHRKHQFKDDSHRALSEFLDSSMEVPYKHFVMVVHEGIRGSHTDVKMKDGSYYKLTSGEEAPDDSLPVTFWACGDIHICQSVAKNAFYPGSPVQTKFSDAWPKGVLVVDTETPESPTFVPISSNQLFKAKKGDVIPPNAYVKWSFTSRDEVPDTLPINVVKVEFALPDSPLSLDIEGSLRDKLLAGVKQQGATDEDMLLAEAEIVSLLEIGTMAGESDF